jgi:hypothetical protein
MVLQLEAHEEGLGDFIIMLHLKLQHKNMKLLLEMVEHNNQPNIRMVIMVKIPQLLVKQHLVVVVLVVGIQLEVMEVQVAVLDLLLLDHMQEVQQLNQVRQMEDMDTLVVLV